MVENNTKFVDFERLLAASPNRSFGTSWQPGLRMLENDPKLVDSERLLTAWAQNGRK